MIGCSSFICGGRDSNNGGGGVGVGVGVSAVLSVLIDMVVPVVVRGILI